MEKYGFVYLWRDKKYNRYYVGSHWGTEEDGYICSSNWMRNSYNRRPSDFKRKIIYKIYSDRKILLEKEHYYLSLIKQEELGVKYYNHTSYVAIPNGNGFHSEETKEKIRKNRLKQKCPRTGKKHSEETKKKFSETRKGVTSWNKGKSLSEEHRKKLKETHKGQIPWNKGMKNEYKKRKEASE
jgi:hypothetical protein